MYSVTERAHSTDCQGNKSTVYANPSVSITPPLLRSDDHYEVEHTYEFTGTTSSAKVSCYTAIGPAQDMVGLICYEHENL